MHQHRASTSAEIVFTVPNLDERVADRFAGLGVEDADVEEDVDASTGCEVSAVAVLHEEGQPTPASRGYPGAHTRR